MIFLHAQIFYIDTNMFVFFLFEALAKESINGLNGQDVRLAMKAF